MPDAFFASTSKKRKRPAQSSAHSRKASRTKNVKGAATKKTLPHPKALGGDEELDSDATHTDIDDLDLRASEVDPAESDTEEIANETPAAKRLRLAKIYLDGVKEELTLGEGEYDAAEIDRDIISARLKEDVLENAGKVHIFIAGSIILEDPPPSRLRIKGHRLSVTSALLSHDATRVYMAGKEGGVSCSDIASGKQLFYAPKLRPQDSAGGKGKRKGKMPVNDLDGHSDEVLALALSGDGKYLVSGGKDRRVGVWDIGDDRKASDDKNRAALVWVRGFGGHKDTISALSFRKSSNFLYSASSDRTIKLFDLSSGVMGYVETLFGHQDSVAGLDSLKGDTAVSCGGRDRTVRFWKITEETQLVFRGGGAGNSKVRDILEGVLDDEELDADDIKRNRTVKGKEKWVEGSVDCVAMVDEQTFLSGGDSGSISLWSVNKKKPIFNFPTAHGLEEIDSSTEGKLRRPRWILSLTCLRYSDLFASGSWDGRIRLWKLDTSLRSFSPIGSLEAPGLINSLQLMVMPKSWTFDKRWPTGNNSETSNKEKDAITSNGVSPHTSPNAHASPNVDTPHAQGDRGVLLIAAMGQEPRLGRWIKLQGNGIVNSGLVFALRTRNG